MSTRLDERSPFALHVEAHGGTLDVSNRAVGGVSVRVWLPGNA